MKDEEDIWAAVEASNRAWASGRPEDAAQLFHPDAVMVAPGLVGFVEGRDGVRDSYVEFSRIATIHDFEHEERDVRVFGDTAVATYRFRIVYQIEDRRSEERGQEILVFQRTPAGWKAMWRTQLHVPD